LFVVIVNQTDGRDADEIVDAQTLATFAATC
jgi:hypothetical protein